MKNVNNMSAYFYDKIRSGFFQRRLRRLLYEERGEWNENIKFAKHCFERKAVFLRYFDPRPEYIVEGVDTMKVLTEARIEGVLTSDRESFISFKEPMRAVKEDKVLKLFRM